jgi:hypothetical protein
MTTFGSLFREGQKIDPLDNGMLARSKAQEVLAGSDMLLWADGSAMPIQNGATIGIAFYSLPDLEFLDRLVLARPNIAGSSSESIAIFDVLSCKTMEDFEKFIPGIGAVYQTPVVGIWKNGCVVEKGIGAKGRMLLFDGQAARQRIRK